MTHAADSTSSTRVEFAGVTADDLEELVALRIAAMRPSLEQLGRFDPKRARERLLQSFHPEHTEVVSLDGRRIGFYTLRPAEDGFHLDHLYIHPTCQSLGVGSHVMRRVAARAGARHLPVYLGALRDSPSNRFYQRHGFVQIREDQWDIYYVRHPDIREAMQRIRPAEPEEAPLLSELAFRSKAHWGYSSEFMAACRNELAVSAADLLANPTFVLEADGRVVGFYSLEEISNATVELGHLFVEADAIRLGHGRTLIEHARSEARRRGYRTLLIQGDPNAEGFYLAIGARRVGTRESQSVPGRQLPLLEVTL